MTEDTGANGAAAPDAAPESGRAAEDDTAAALDAWWARLTAALGLDEVVVDRDALLGLAGVAAHEIVRPAAPLTTFLAGYAAGLAGGSAGEVAAAIERARAAAKA